MSNYFYFHNKSWQGPLSFDDLKSLYAKGVVTDDTLVKTDGGKPMLAFECLANSTAAAAKTAAVVHRPTPASSQPVQYQFPSADFADGAPYLPCAILEFSTYAFIILGVLHGIAAVLFLVSEGFPFAFASLAGGGFCFFVSALLRCLIRLTRDTVAVRWHLCQISHALSNQPPASPSSPPRP
ncbi:MAG: DUF4339 domain-containing protein [Pirellulales bacterium]